MTQVEAPDRDQYPTLKLAIVDTVVCDHLSNEQHAIIPLVQMIVDVVIVGLCSDSDSLIGLPGGPVRFTTHTVPPCSQRRKRAWLSGREVARC